MTTPDQKEQERSDQSYDDFDRLDQLTVGQLKAIIRQTVQEAFAEVLMEFTIAAEYDAELAYQAEVTELLRQSLQERLAGVSSLMTTHDD
jgi:hypothetical protein